jgi:hypothetical protein
MLLLWLLKNQYEQVKHLWQRLQELSRVLPIMPPCTTSEAQDVDLVFGFGSLLDDESRLSTMSHTCRGAILCHVRGFVRSWCFRSDTGFTALGGFEAEPSAAEASIAGIIFPAGTDLDSLDKRERGYHRVQIALEDITLAECSRNCTCDCKASGSGSPFSMRRGAALPQRGQCSKDLIRRVASMLRKDAPAAASKTGIQPRVWVYLPEPRHVRPASADYPICQTYLDVVLNGCFSWGGEEMAREFCLSTEGWSRYWLNDVTQSRRPWLHRKPKWREIDAVLEKLSVLTCFHDRKHSEEYAVFAAALDSKLQRPRNSHAPGTTQRSASFPDLGRPEVLTVPDAIRFQGLT